MTDDSLADSQLPPVTVVIPVLQGEAHIACCIESLLAQNYPADKLQIIVVDNGSTDKTVEVARAYPVRVEREPRRGAARARNRGIALTTTPLVAFTDCDCEAEPDWIRSLVARFSADPKLGGCGGPLIPAPPQSSIEEYVIAKDILSQERAMRPEPLSPPFLVTANAMYRKEALDAVGGFDEDCTINGEDADLAWRVKWAGYKIAMEPSARVVHHHRSTLHGLLRQIRSYGGGAAWLFAKHHERFGRESCIDPGPYIEIIGALARAPFRLVFARNRLERVTPIYDFLGATAFLSGKISQARKKKVRFY